MRLHPRPPPPRWQEVYGAQSGMDGDFSLGPRERVPVGIIHPNSRLRLGWDIFAIILILQLSIMLPYRLAFARSWGPVLVGIDFLTDIYFMVDIFLNFSTAYFYDDEVRARLAPKALIPRASRSPYLPLTAYPHDDER